MRKLATIILAGVAAVLLFASTLSAWEETCTWTGPTTMTCCGVDNWGAPYCTEMECTVYPGGDYTCIEVQDPNP